MGWFKDGDAAMIALLLALLGSANGLDNSAAPCYIAACLGKTLKNSMPISAAVERSCKERRNTPNIWRNVVLSGNTNTTQTRLFDEWWLKAANVDMLLAGLSGSCENVMASGAQITTVFFQSKKDDAPFVGVEIWASAGTVNDCVVSRSIIVIEQEKSEDCFARHAMRLLDVFQRNECFSGRYNTSQRVGVDGIYLCAVALSEGIPPEVLLAVAWRETRTNVNPNIRGAAGEIGRLQVSPKIQWRHPACARDSLRLYASNLRCGAAILRSNFDAFGSWTEAVRRYNGSGPQSRKYQREILAYIGWMRLREQ